VDILQGYHFGHALPGHELEELPFFTHAPDMRAALPDTKSIVNT